MKREAILIFMIFFLPGMIFFHSCRKEIYTVESIRVTVSPGKPLRDLVFLNDSLGFACGGIPLSEGFIYRTRNGGQTWEPVFRHSFKCLYTLCMHPDGYGMAGGDSLVLIRTRDFGITWFDHWMGNSVPQHVFNHPRFSESFAIPPMTYMVAGEYYKKGVVYVSPDYGETWTHAFFPNELSGLTFANPDTGWFCGNGILLQTRDRGLTLEDRGMQGEFFSCIHRISPDILFLGCHSGAVYRSTDSGKTWNRTATLGNGGYGSQGIVCMDISGRRIAVAGENGFLCVSEDAGVHCTEYSSGTEAMIHSLCFHNGWIWLAAADGYLYRIRTDAR